METCCISVLHPFPSFPLAPRQQLHLWGVKAWLVTLLAFFQLSLLLSLYFPGLGSLWVKDEGGKGKELGCDYGVGEWRFDPARKALYDEKCLFHRKGWTCGRNGKPGMERMYGWNWVAAGCNISVIKPARFLEKMRNRNIGFVGDSLNENLMVSLLCILTTVDGSARKWKKRGAWRGAFFPAFNVTIAYHRAVLLAQYNEWRAGRPDGVLERYGLLKGFRVDVDVPAKDWINITAFYHVLIFNTGHWWGLDKFPQDTPLIFFKGGLPVLPPLNMSKGLELLLGSMVEYIQQTVPANTLKLWRTQSPRHFDGGEWNENGSCTYDHLLDKHQVEMWFQPENGGVNKEEREVNRMIRTVLKGTGFRLLDVAPMSEFRADAHPALWLGNTDSYKTWGQDCLHWCLPGIPDIWVDFLGAIILEHSDSGFW